VEALEKTFEELPEEKEVGEQQQQADPKLERLEDTTMVVPVDKQAVVEGSTDAEDEDVDGRTLGEKFSTLNLARVRMSNKVNVLKRKASDSENIEIERPECKQKNRDVLKPLRPSGVKNLPGGERSTTKANTTCIDGT